MSPSPTRTVAPPAPQWVIDLNSLPPRRRPNSSSIPDPPGFTSQIGSSNKKQVEAARASSTPEQTDDLYIKKAWEIAIAPGKSLPMNAIMMYMSGNSLQIFSVMMTFMLFMNPLKALFSVGSTFARFENDRTKSRLLVVKIAYILLQFVTIALGIWKVNGMGLLPTTRSDWLAWERERQPLETSAPLFT